MRSPTNVLSQKEFTSVYKYGTVHDDGNTYIEKLEGNAIIKNKNKNKSED